MSRLVRGWWPIGCLLLILSMGCMKDAVVFGTSTRFGIELNTTEPGQQGIRVGYKRAEGVTMPTRDESGNLHEETFSTLSAFRFSTGNLLLAALGLTEVEQYFATGAAADAASTDAQTLANFLALSGSFVDSEARDCLTSWATTKEKMTVLGQWMEEEQSLPNAPVSFINSDGFTDEKRKQAIRDLSVPCE